MISIEERERSGCAVGDEGLFVARASYSTSTGTDMSLSLQLQPLGSPGVTTGRGAEARQGAHKTSDERLHGLGTAGKKKNDLGISGYAQC